MKSKKFLGGFTLIELLAVISIIGILSAITIGSFGEARKKSRITKRIADLKQVQLALQMYRSAKGSYPLTATKSSQCSAWGSAPDSNDIIPDLAPNYLSKVPSDPVMDVSGNQNCYIYISDGVDYKFIDYNVTDMTPSQFALYPDLLDPCRGGSLPGSCTWPSATIYSLSVGSAKGNVTW